MPYPIRNRSRSELSVRMVTGYNLSQDKSYLNVRYSVVEGLEAVRNRIAWVRVSRWNMADWLRAMPWPDDLKDDVERVASYLERGPERST